MKQNVKEFIKKICYYFFRIFCRSQKAVFFYGMGLKYNDNSKAVSEKLHELRPEINILWYLGEKSNINEIPAYIRVVKGKFGLLKELACTCVFVTSGSLIDVPKSKNKFNILLWHGDRAFKKILYDSEFVSQNFVLPESKDGFCDLAVAGSEYGVMQFRSAFKYKGEVLKIGTPRNDLLVENDKHKALLIKEKLELAQDICILLYAPTLRRKNVSEKSSQRIQQIDLQQTLKKLQEKNGKSWICLLRGHPAVDGLCGYEKKANILDVSEYEDMADLLLISDMLITDYSSCAGDFALLNRPIALFQADRDEYNRYDRGFYFDIGQSPYWVAKNQGDLNMIIEVMNNDSIMKNCHDILDFYKTNETGKASEAVAKRIISWIDKEQDK